MGAGEEVTGGADASGLAVVAVEGMVEGELHEAFEGDGGATHVVDDCPDECRRAEGSEAGVEIERHSASLPHRTAAGHGGEGFEAGVFR